MILSRLPFHIGPQPYTSNPKGLPNLMDMELAVDDATGLLVQVPNTQLQENLDNAYRLGSLIGTPLAGQQFGTPYAEDFRTFIRRHRPVSGNRALEIGAGAGFLSKLLEDDGWEVDALEPGVGYEALRSKLGVQVVQDFFPSKALPGPYDLIVCFAVLEHIESLPDFLAAIRSHLSESGVFIFGVPDCEDEIRAGDPSILIHEHYSYFSQVSLESTVRKYGFSGPISKSGFGRSLYGAVVDVKGERRSPVGLDGMSHTYWRSVSSYIQELRAFFSDLAAEGDIGVFAAGRGINFLDSEWSMRFFDDNPEWTGLYFPPFECPIENRESLFSRPVNHLVILSRTFGQRISHSLREEGYRGQISLSSDIDSCFE